MVLKSRLVTIDRFVEVSTIAGEDAALSCSLCFLDPYYCFNHRFHVTFHSNS